MEKRARGKKCIIDRDKFEKLLLQNKDKLVIDGKIATVKGASAVWNSLADSLDVQSGTLYSYAVDIRHPYRGLLLNEHIDKSIESSDSSFNDSAQFSKPQHGDFEFKMTKVEFQEIVKEKSVKAGKNKIRFRTILSPREWEDMVQLNLWNYFRIQHGFHFETHNLTRDASSGKISGHCSCGSTINIEIDNEDDDLFAIFNCHITKGDNKKLCKPRQLRGKTREKICGELENKSVDVYRSEKRRELQNHGDPNPPTLYSEQVLRTAKHQHSLSQHKDKDPVISLKILKRTALGRDVIRDIGSDPFFVHIFSSDQIRLWNMYRETCPLLFDSTTGIAQKVNILPNVKSHTLSLHLGVINCELGQLAVFSGITERQDALSIEMLLRKFFQKGANLPIQAVTDQGRPLQNVIVRTCTTFSTIEDYCDGFIENRSKMESVTLLSIDVNHYIKDWAVFFKSIGVQGVVKTFFMACIGELVMCKTLKEARHIIEMILKVALSPKDGELQKPRKGRKLTYAQEANEELFALITGQEPIYEEFLNKAGNDCTSGSESDSEIDSQDVEDVVEYMDTTSTQIAEQQVGSRGGTRRRKVTKWEQWALDIKSDVEALVLCDEGKHINAYKSDAVANRLVREIRHLPMWSNIYNRKFYCTNIRPSSSASVECEIKTLKRSVLKGDGKKYRVDRTVELIIKFYDGKLRILGPESNHHNKINTNDKTTCNDTASKKYSSTDKNSAETDMLAMDTSSSKSETSLEVHNDTVASDSRTTNSKMPVIKFDENLLNRECPACLIGHKPPGAHVCVDCNTPVHALIGCSTMFFSNFDVDDCEEKRICKVCAKKRIGEKTEDAELNENNFIGTENYAQGRSSLNMKNVLDESTECEKCRKGENKVPAYFCHICGKNVHNTPQCSMPLSFDCDDESAKKLLICTACSKGPDIDKIVAMNEVENHKGLAIKDILNDNKQNRVDKYLGGSRQQVRDTLMYGRKNDVFKSLPLIKRGSHSSLQLITVNKTRISLKNTCAVDSAFQLYLVICSDYPFYTEVLKMKNKKQLKHKDTKSSKEAPVNEVLKNFIQMILQTVNAEKLTAGVYERRAKMMISFHKKILAGKNKLQYIDCSCDIGDLIRHMLHHHPSLQVIQSCPQECTVQDKIFETILIERNYFNDKGLATQIESLCSVEEKCSNCESNLVNSIKIESVIAIELYGFDVTRLEVKISSIPKHFYFREQNYSLVGFINFIGDDIPKNIRDLPLKKEQEKKRGKENLEKEIQKEYELGHYTAICFRGKKWILYDDFRDQAEYLKSSVKVKPKVLFYVKSNRKDL